MTKLRAAPDRAHPDALLVKGRGFSEGILVLSALPYAIAACANLGGGACSDVLDRIEQ